MSINACSINGNTINALCNPARSKIINNLLEIKYPATSGVATHPAHGAFYRYQDRREERSLLDPVHVEIVVAVELLTWNLRGLDAQPMEIGHDLVAVSNLSFDDAVVLNTHDLTFN